MKKRVLHHKIMILTKNKYDNLTQNQSININEKKIQNKVFKIGLVGNPNSGKTTLFNRLTGSNQYVGNWPGVTVEKKEGVLKSHRLSSKIIDLPGIYSLSPYSPEEVLTRDFIANECPDLIINIIDSTNIERNLYLTTQLMELDCNIILAVNMIDILEKKGKIIDYNILEKRLNIPVIPISASICLASRASKNSSQALISNGSGNGLSNCLTNISI